MEIEMPILKALESIRFEFLNGVMRGLTFLGEETVYMVLAIFFFWCVDKWKGYYLLSTGFLGTIASQTLKILCRVPRPWVRDPSIAVESAKEGAGGYSFPSGHTQGASCTFLGIARTTKRNRLCWIGMIVLVLLIGFSRMYLGVHYPSDVGVGLLLGVAVVLLLYPILQKAKESTGFMYGFLAAMLLITLGYLVFVRFGKFPEDAYVVEEGSKDSNWSSAMKNAWTLLGCILGLIVSYTADLKTKFSEKAPLLGQICKIVLGLAIIMGIREGTRPVFALISENTYGRAARYFCMVVFAGAIWPLTFPLWQKLGAKKSKKQ